jgi:hypothetical protein
MALNIVCVGEDSRLSSLVQALLDIGKELGRGLYA